MTLTGPPVLSAGDHQGFIDDGFVVLRGVIGPDLATQVLAATTTEGDDEQARARRREGARLCALALLPAVNELHGPRYPVEAGEVPGGDMARPVNADSISFANPHLDLLDPTFVPDSWAVGAFVLLTPATARNGAFMYAPGSPRRMRSVMSRYCGEAAFGRTKSDTEAGTVVHFTGEPGDAILFQHPMVHSASPNIEGPGTRHAIRLGFKVRPRLAVPPQSTEALSPVEKANSVRYLRQRFGEEFFLVDVPDVVPELADGFGPAVAHDTLKHASRVHRFWAVPEDPAVIRTAVSTDLAGWSPTAPLRLGGDPVVGIHLEHRFNPTLTVVRRTPGGGAWSQVYESTDLASWRQISGMRGWTLSRPHFVQEQQVGPFWSRRAYGSIWYFAPDERPGEVWWRCGGNREELSSWKDQGIAHRGAGRIGDLWCRPGPAPMRHVLVADIDGRAHYTVSETMDDFQEPFRPFERDGAAVSSLRCFARADGYWLVTFLREGRVRWGEVDWSAAPGTLGELRTADALRTALGTTGLG